MADAAATRLLLTFFVLASLLLGWLGSSGEDLAPAWLGCRLINAGQAEALYSHDRDDFAQLHDARWQAVAQDSGYAREFIHPYVQTPLFAALFTPICDHADFATLNLAMIAINAIMLFACLTLIARAWAPRLADRRWLMALMLLTLLAAPYPYHVLLGQTHALTLFLTLRGLMLSLDGRARAGGLLLALATTLKLTPVLALVWLLLSGRRAAALWGLAGVAGLALLTWLSLGASVLADYLGNLERIAGSLILAINNQSFAAWLSQLLWPVTQIHDFTVRPMPPALTLASMLLMLLSLCYFSAMTRRRADAAAIAAMAMMVTMTLFAPIAWTHYFIVLPPALMILLQHGLAQRRRGVLLAAAGIAGLLLLPLDKPWLSETSPWQLMLSRNDFSAGALTLATLALLARRPAPSQRGPSREDA